MLCKLQKADWKKIDKQAKDVLTFDYMSGILTKLFDGDEVNESGAWRSEKIGKKKSEKDLKKVLDKRNWAWYNSECSAWGTCTL